MKYLEKWYSGFKWRDRLIVAGSFMAIAIATALVSSVDVLFISALVAALLVLSHFILSKSTSVMVLLVSFMHLIGLSVAFVAYASLGSESLGSSSTPFAIISVSLATVALTWLSYKFSVGRLWITLGLAYLTLDILGPLFMLWLKLYNPLIGIGLAGVMVAIRSVLWRDLLRNRKAEIPAGLKNGDSAVTLKALLESIDGVEISSIESDAVDIKVTTPSNSYYLNAITLGQRVVVTAGDVASGRYNLKSTLFETANTANKFNNSLKRKERKTTIPCVVNITDKSDSKIEINVSLSGTTRDEGKNVFILSPSSLVKMIKRDIKDSQQPAAL